MKKLILTALLVLLILPNNCFPENSARRPRVFELSYSDAADVFPAVEHLKSPEGKVTLINKTNQIVVYDYPANITVMEKVIAQLDIKKDQVGVHVLVAEVGSHVLGRLNLSLGTTNLSPREFTEISHSIDKGTESVKKDEMYIRTLDGEPARLSMSQEQIFGGTITQQQGILVVVPQTARSAGDFLEVMPKINNDGTITVTIMPTVSKFEDDGSTIYEKSILAKTTVNDGDTVVLGGAMSSGEIAIENSIPKVPASNTQYAAASTKVLMFLTVNVIK